MKNKMLAAAGVLLLIIIALFAYLWFNASHLGGTGVAISNPFAQSGPATTTAPTAATKTTASTNTVAPSSKPSCVLSTNKKVYKPSNPNDQVIVSWTTQNATSVSFTQNLQSAGTEIFQVPRGQQALSGSTKLPLSYVDGYEVIQLDVTGPEGSSSCTTDFYMSSGTASMTSSQVISVGTLPATFTLGTTAQVNKMAAESSAYNLTLTLESAGYEAADKTTGTVVLVKDHNTEFPVYILNNHSTLLSLISGHLTLAAVINKDSSVTFTLSN
jgi:hypothetical protein